jgi:hypothetical protein
VAWLIEEGTWDMYYLGSYLSFLPWKIPELLVIEATEVYIKVGGWSSSISYHILPLTATMNWICTFIKRKRKRRRRICSLLKMKTKRHVGGSLPSPARSFQLSS